MSFDSRTLFELFPAIHRIRDLEQAARTPNLLSPAERVELQTLEALAPPLTPLQQRRLDHLRDRLERGPLRAFTTALAEQIAVLEENLDQLDDDGFIETCAEWVVPYIGDLIGYRTLHGVAEKVRSRRAEVAHTIGFRRRKGTAAMLEQLARDVTGWNARVVEFFQLVATCQHMNHLRPWNHYGPDLRRWEPLERRGTAFESIAHTVEVRTMRRGGRFNVPNVGVYLWRLDAMRLTDSPAVKVDDRRYRFDPRGIDQQLVTSPETEDEISHLAEPLNVPAPISRRVLRERLNRYYGPNRSLLVSIGGAPVAPEKIRICNLHDMGATWAHLPPAGQFAIDPLLGRLALPPVPPVSGDVQVTFHTAVPAMIGGGEYERADSFEAIALDPVVRVPDDQPTIQQALAALAGAGVVEITDSGRYVEVPAIAVAAGKRIELRARNGRRPILVLSSPLDVSAGADGQAVINGLLIEGDTVRVASGAGNQLRRLRLAHCTLIPGQRLTPDGNPATPGAESLRVELPQVTVEIDRSIVGALRIDSRADAVIADSIVDANADDAMAYAATDGASAGASLTMHRSTVVGRVHATVLHLVSDSLLAARPPAGDPTAQPVRAVRTQEGCVRFSYIPPGSRVPRRYRCQPESGSGTVAPRFVSLQYGAPAYAQLAPGTPAAIRRGASNESEMGVYNHLMQPQREADLQYRLDEYLRVGLQAGVFYES